MRINKIHHVAIICSDFQKSKQFYVDILGFKILQETFRVERSSYKLDLLVGDQYQIELFSFPAPPERLSHPEARGLRHLAFEVDAIEKAVEELQTKEIQVEPIRIDPVTNKKYIFFQDPDGLPLELYER